MSTDPQATQLDSTTAARGVPRAAARADLHVHSRYSDRPSEWLLRRIGAPESFTEPRRVYELARERGMDFVTISDHNRIDGALEIAHLPGTFLSCEVTTYFPEDGCKIHVLATGISEEQFRDIDRARASIYELRDYLLDRDILHSVAHPLFSVNDRLTIEHVEKLLLLFKRFEGLNGARAPRAGEIFRAVCAALTPATIGELADHHRLDPRDPQPWVKLFTGGSDDHGGLHIAEAWTETPPAATAVEFLSHLRAGEQSWGGMAGSSLRLAHSFYRISYGYYRHRLLGDLDGKDLFSELFRRFVGDPLPAATGAGDRLRRAAAAFLRPRTAKKETLDRTLAESLASLVDLQANGVAHEERAFAEASRMSQQLSYAFVNRLAKHLRRGELTESLETLSALGPVALCIAPYLAAFHTQHKDERLLQRVAHHFPAARPLARRSQRKAWITDTLADTNGVAVTIQTVGALAKRAGHELHVLSSLATPPRLDLELVNFPPIGEFRLPEYDAQRLGFPPFLEVIAHCERQGYAELILSTPGTLGLAGLAAARLLGIRTTGIYHTDFPMYVRFLTESETLESLTWRYMRWFFAQMDVLYVPSAHYLERLAERGFDRSRMRLLPRGVDFVRFSPARRDPAIWQRFGLGDGFKFLYVGRMSREKNLDALLSAFFAVLATGRKASLVMVGDGPYLEELRRRYPRPEVLFTGFLHGEELATVYASADLFVFPSTTDTFGNVVLEAQASGLPAIVSEHGGPQELVGPSRSGVIVDPSRAGSLAEAMIELYDSHALRKAMAARAVDAARRSGWEGLFRELWADKEGSEPEIADHHGSILRSEPLFMPSLDSF